ncbi:MAG TPA: phosphoribosylglycinamide formyltransferase [Clostridiales bacterium]|nr:phosphoribosylglycinamide formyltransferase [Clostridiales bacterium]
MTEIVDIINRDKDEKDKTSLQNLSNKLRRGSLRYDEILEIAEACGYEIAWMRKE